jgi:hypothetical protein
MFGTSHIPVGGYLHYGSHSFVFEIRTTSIQILIGYKGGTSSYKGNDAKIKGSCWSCNKPGHRSADCRSAKKEYKGEQANKASEIQKRESRQYDDQGDVVLPNISQAIENTTLHLWLLTKMRSKISQC